MASGHVQGVGERPFFLKSQVPTVVPLLQVGKDFVTEYAESERRAEERLEAEVEGHIQVLRKLRVKVAERDELR